MKIENDLAILPSHDTNSYLLICDYRCYSSKKLRSKVQIVTKEVVKSEV